MPGLVPGIHVLTASQQVRRDGRDKPGHDGETDHLPDATNARFVLRCAIANRGIPRFRVRCFVSPRNDGFDVSQSLSPPSRRQRAAAPAQADILQLGESADHNRLCRNKDFAEQVRRHRA
jgi:hypothetical protein